MILHRLWRGGSYLCITVFDRKEQSCFDDTMDGLYVHSDLHLLNLQASKNRNSLLSSRWMIGLSKAPITLASVPKVYILLQKRQICCSIHTCRLRSWGSSKLQFVSCTPLLDFECSGHETYRRCSLLKVLFSLRLSLVYRTRSQQCLHPVRSSLRRC